MTIKGKLLVGILTKNCSKWLGDVLKNVNKYCGEFESYYALIIDGYSNDDTEKIAHTWCKSDTKNREFKCQPTKPEIRDLAITEARNYTMECLKPQFGDNVYLLLNGGTANTAQNDSRDYSKNNRILNIYGNTQVSTSIKKMGAGSIYFDGSGDYIQSTITDWSPGVNNEPFTIEMWTYSLNITSTRVFISKNGGANSWNTNNGLNFKKKYILNY